MGREENVAIFRDTERIVKETPKLKETVQCSTANQKLILESNMDYGQEPEKAAEQWKYIEGAKDELEMVTRCAWVGLNNQRCELPARITVSKKKIISSSR